MGLPQHKIYPNLSLSEIATDVLSPIETKLPAITLIFGVFFLIILLKPIIFLTVPFFEGNHFKIA